jgi:hypothetical protein
VSYGLQSLALSVDRSQLVSHRTTVPLKVSLMLIHSQDGLIRYLRYLPKLVSLRLLKQDGAPHQFFPPPGSTEHKLYSAVPTWIKPGLTSEEIARRCNGRHWPNKSLKYIMIDQVAFEVVREVPCRFRPLGRDEIRANPIFAIREKVGLCGLTVVEH